MPPDKALGLLIRNLSAASVRRMLLPVVLAIAVAAVCGAIGAAATSGPAGAPLAARVTNRP